MSEDFNWSRSSISLAASLGFLLNGLIQPFVGGIFDRLGGRVVIGWGLIILGLATFSLAFTFHILFLVFMFGVVSSVALSAISITTTAALLSKWFRRRRATVMGLNSAGVSVGGLLLVPFAMYLLQATNWRVTWAVLGLMVLALGVPLAFLFIRDDPAKMGLQPDGDAAPTGGAAGRSRGLGRGPLDHRQVGRFPPQPSHVADDVVLFRLRRDHGDAGCPLRASRPQPGRFPPPWRRWLSDT